MLWVLKRTVSMRWFFWAAKTYAKIYGYENTYNFTLKILSLSKPVKLSLIHEISLCLTEEQMNGQTHRNKYREVV